VKVHIRPEKGCGKARLAAGLPGEKDLNQTMVAERHKRVTAGLDIDDAAAKMKSSMPFGGFERARQFSWEPAGMDDKRG
jgi:hypothetical protein